MDAQNVQACVSDDWTGMEPIRAQIRGYADMFQPGSGSPWPPRLARYKGSSSLATSNCRDVRPSG
jgi:hypothetical protein